MGHKEGLTIFSPTNVKKKKNSYHACYNETDSQLTLSASILKCFTVQVSLSVFLCHGLYALFALFYD